MLPPYPKFLWALTPLVLCVLWMSHAWAWQVQLAWDAPTNPDGTPLATLAGYHLYYWQSSSGAPQQQVDVGQQTTYTLTGLREGETYAFAVTAYDTAEDESSDSNIVTATFPAREGLAGLDAQGSIWYSTDLVNWIQVPGTLTAIVAGDF